MALIADEDLDLSTRMNLVPIVQPMANVIAIVIDRIPPARSSEAGFAVAIIVSTDGARSQLPHPPKKEALPTFERVTYSGLKSINHPEMREIRTFLEPRTG